MWMKCPHPYIPKLHSQANTIIGSLHFSIARGNCSDGGIWQGSSQCGEDTPPGRCHCQLCQPGRCTGCVRLIRNTIICLVYFCQDHFIVNVHPHVWQFKSPFGHLAFLQTKYPHLSLVPRPSHSSVCCLQYYLGTRLPTSINIQISSVQLH